MDYINSTSNSRSMTMSQEMKLLLSPGNSTDAPSSNLAPFQGDSSKRVEVTQSSSSGGKSTGNAPLNDKEKEKLLVITHNVADSSD